MFSSVLTQIVESSPSSPLKRKNLTFDSCEATSAPSDTPAVVDGVVVVDSATKFNPMR